MASSAAMLPGLPAGGQPSEGAPGGEGFTPSGGDSDFDAIFGAEGSQPASNDAPADDGHEPTLEEMLVDKATLSPEELEMAGLAEETAPTPQKPAKPAAPPAPDANQQFQLMMMQQMQAMQQANQEFQARLLESMRPPKQEQAPSKFDIASVLPENLRSVDGVPQLAQAIYSQVEKQFAERDQASQTAQQQAQHQAAVSQWVNEARHVQTEVLKDGYKFSNPQDAHFFSSMARDLAISMADAKGGTPAQYLGPIKETMKAGAMALLAGMGEKTKAGIAKRVPNAPLHQAQKRAAQMPTDASMSMPDRNSRPTPEELRAVRMTGSQSAMEGDYSVLKLRAQRARQGQR